MVSCSFDLARGDCDPAAWTVAQFLDQHDFTRKIHRFKWRFKTIKRVCLLRGNIVYPPKRVYQV